MLASLRILPILLLPLTQALAPITKLSSTAKAVPDSYIVVLKEGITGNALTKHLSWADEVLRTNSGTGERNQTWTGKGFNGYHVRLPKKVAEKLAESDDIAFIEPDATLTLPPTTTSSSLVRRVTQTNAPWNLARISHRQRGSTDYVYQPISGVYAYIFGTGIKSSHTAFAGNVINGYNVFPGTSFDDLNGWGTAVAGIVSSATYGVARFAQIINVKALSDNGSTSIANLITAINWAVNDSQTRGAIRNQHVALLAVGGSFSSALNQAVASGSASGLMFAVAAGNENANVASFSPASEPSACTVGGTTINDQVMSTSNYGALLDIYAPGQNIVVPWITSNTATNTISGSSVASAHVAGLGAYFLAIEGPRTPAALIQRLKAVATANILTGVPSGTVNLLVYNNSGL